MWILKITPHLAYVATLPCKEAINDKLQGSVATYLRYGEVVNKYIEKSRRVEKNLKSVNIWQHYKQERGCLMHFARLANTLLMHETITFLLVNLPDIHRFNKMSLSDSAINLFSWLLTTATTRTRDLWSPVS